jgi:hypothetical protein
VNIARALFDRLEDQRVDELDERARRLVLGGFDVLLVREAVVLGGDVTTRRLELALEVAQLELDVLSRRTPRTISRRVAIRSSSTDWTSAGSAIATRRRSPSNA